MHISRVTKLFLCAAAGLMALSAVTACNKSSSGARQVQPYTNDGYLGLSSSNPNLPNGGSYHNYTRDTKMMEDILKQIPEVLRNRIVLNGSNAYVKLTLKGNPDAAETRRIESHARKLLMDNMPRYTVYLTSNGPVQPNGSY